MILSRQVLSDEENMKTCVAEWQRASSAEAVTAWAANWGDAITDHLHSPPVSAEDIERVEKEATEFEEDYQHLASAVSDAVEEMDAASEMPSERRQAEYERIAADLNKVLNK